MSIPKKYYWRNNEGKLQSSIGIELEDWEKGELARKNNKLIKEQLCHAEKNQER